MITFEHHPDNEGLIDQFTSLIYEQEWFGTHSHEYAMEVVHHYTDPFFADDWFVEWILTEEFRGEKWPDGNPIPPDRMLRYEKMYDLYWTAYAEFGYKMIANLDRKNREELTRNQFLHTLTTTMRWEEFGRQVRAINDGRGIVTHNLKEEE